MFGLLEIDEWVYEWGFFGRWGQGMNAYGYFRKN